MALRRMEQARRRSCDPNNKTSQPFEKDLDLKFNSFKPDPSYGRTAGLLAPENFYLGATQPANPPKVAEKCAADRFG